MISGLRLFYSLVLFVLTSMLSRSRGREREVYHCELEIKVKDEEAVDGLSGESTVTQGKDHRWKYGLGKE